MGTKKEVKGECKYQNVTEAPHKEATSATAYEAEGKRHEEALREKWNQEKT